MSYDIALLGKKASAFAPASTGNVSVGFDLLGAALIPINGAPLGDTVHVAFAEQDSMVNSGEFAHVCPEDKSQNLAWQAYELFRQRLANPSAYPNVAMELVKSLPVGSGLGSSACSVVAALAALNRLFDNYFNDNELLLLMGEAEAGASGSLHYDNVAPSYFGGLQLMSPLEDSPIIHLPTPQSWYWVVAFPGFSLPTKEAREALPEKYAKKDSIKNAQHLAAFTAYLFGQEEGKAARVIKDVMAEPYRAELIKGFAENKQALLDKGALAFGISGAGPTVFALTTDLAQAKEFQQHLEQNYIEQQGFVHICKCAELGAKSIDVE